MERKKRTWLPAALAGGAAGIANGFFGGGGGMILVPLLVSRCGLTRRKAFATSVAVILPLCVLGFCLLIGLTGLLPDSVLPSAVMMACMPCGLNPVVFPKLIGQDCRLGARLILLSSILSCITIPFWMQLLT